MTLEYSRQFFKKLANNKFQENPSSGSRGVPCGQTDGQMNRRKDEQMEGLADRHGEVNFPLSQFCEHA
jgi:hypothetical protein